MEKQEFAELVTAYVGSRANICGQIWQGGTLHLILKDAGMADLDAIRSSDAVAEVTLIQARVAVTPRDNVVKGINMASKDKYQAIVERIVDAVGGKDNIEGFTHCLTRLRFNVKDKTKVDEQTIKNLPASMGFQWAGNQLQVIVGNAVSDVYDMICEAHGIKKEAAIEENLDAGKKRFSVGTLLDMISGCVIPIIPILMGVGMIKVFYTLASQVGLLDPASTTYQVLDFVNNAAFYFLPIYVGASAAKKFGCNMATGMLMGGILLAPAFVTAVGEGTPLDFFGLPIHSATYGSTIFPTILTVFVASKLEKLITKLSPEILRAILVPTLTIFIMIPIELCLLAPIGSYLGNYLAQAIEFIFANLGFLASAIFGVLFPILVLFGMHTCTAPVTLIYMAAYNCEPFSIASFVSTCTLGAVCIAVMLRTHNMDMESTAGTCAATALIGGITEPALYGVALRFRKPFYAALIGDFVGGAIAGLFGVMCYAQGPSCLITFAKWISPDNPMNLVGALVAAAVASAIAFAITYFVFYRSTDPMAEEN